MKMINPVGCSIEGITEKEAIKFKKKGWMTEDEYFKLHPEEKDDNI